VRVLFGILRANPLGGILTAAMLIYEYWEPISAFFAELWDGIREKFPNFAAMAERAARAVKEFFGPAVAWVKDMLANLLPDWLSKKLGIKQEGGQSPAAAAQNAAGAAAALNAPALVPGPAEQSALTASANAGVELNADTNIHVYTSDPASAGQEVAARQQQVNADLVRHTRGAAR